MDNLEWLKSIKKTEEKIEDVIKKAQNSPLADDKVIEDFKMNYRKIKALEIIAEEFIYFNKFLAHIRLKGMRIS